MRAMNHPDYKRTYWTPERREAASKRAKEMWRKKREREARLRAQKRASPIGKCDEEIGRLYKRQEQIRREWFALNERREQLLKARNDMASAFDILKQEGCEEWLTWLND